MTAQEEARLIRRVLDGDADAFEPLVREHQTKVYHLAYRMLGNEEDAADAAQEALIRAYTSLSGFREESRFSSWLYRLTNNVCLDMLRRRGRQNTVSLVTEDEDGEETEREIPDESADPALLAERAEDARLVREAIASLPPDCREILTLREIGGLSYEELAAALQLEPGTVRSRLNRARKKLRDALLATGNFSGAASSNGERGA